MGIFNFWKKEKSHEKSIVGRNQQFLWVKKFLGDNVADMDWQIAVNKDIGEYNEIAEEIKNLNDYIHSEIFTTQLDVLQAKNDADKILEKGYDNCVLQNNPELEERLLKIVQDAIDYAKNRSQFSDEQKVGLNELTMYSRSIGLLKYMDLSGLLSTADQQMAWVILSKRVPQTISILAPDELPDSKAYHVSDYAKNLREFVKKMIDKKSANNSVDSVDEVGRLKEVEAEINKGLELNKEYHKSKI